MGEHCDNCYCDPEKICFGIQRRLSIRLCTVMGMLAFIALAIIMLLNAQRNNFKGWSTAEFYTFLILLLLFAFCFLTVILLELFLIVEFFWSCMCGIYSYFWDFIHYLRRQMRVISWQNIRVRYSRQPALARPECPSSDSDTDEEPPELPPKSGFILKTAAPQPFQKFTADIEHGASASATSSDRRQTKADPPNLPGCSGIQSATSQTRPKPRPKKQSLRQKLAGAINMRTIDESEEASGTRQNLSNIEIPFSVLLQKPQSPASTTQETSFISCSDASEAEQQAQASGIPEIQCHEHASAAGFSGSQGQARAAGIESPKNKQESREQPLAAGYVGFSALQSQARTPDVRDIQRMQEGREQISVAESSGLQTQARASDIQKIQKSRVQTSATESSGLQTQARASDIQKMQKSRVQTSAAESSGLQTQVRASDIQVKQESGEQISAAGSCRSRRQARASDIPIKQESRKQISVAASSGLQGQVEASSIQKMQKSRVQTSAAGFSVLGRGAQASDIQMKQKIRKQTSAEGFSGLGRGAQASDIQIKQKIRKQTSAAGFSELKREACESDVKETENKSEGREQTSAAGYVGFSGLKRQAGESDIKGIQKNRGQASAIGYSGLERKERGSETKQLQREEKSGEDTSVGHASTSGVASRIKLASTQEAERNIPRRRSVQREDEEDQSVERSPKEDSSLASLEGAVGQEARKIGTFSSLNLTGGNLVVSRHEGAEADEGILSSGMDPSGSAFMFDQPMDVLDLSHIEVPIIQTENEEETTEDDDDKKEDESIN